MTATELTTVLSAWVDELLPPGCAVEELSTVRLTDNGSPFQLGPLDQVVVALSDVAVTRRSGAASPVVVQVPRGRHDVAVGIGFTLQVLRMHAYSQGALGATFSFPGAVTVIGMDTAVAERLKTMQVIKARFARGLAEGLGTFRVRSDGSLADARGATIRYESVRQPLLYLNARRGWPSLPGERNGVVVIDRTSFGSAETLDRALEWAERHAALAVVVVCDLGDRASVQQLSVSHIPTVVPLTPALVSDVQYALGDGAGSASITTNPLLIAPAQRWRIAGCDADPVIAGILHEGMDAVIEARKVKAPMPYPVVQATRLVLALARCTAPLDIFNDHARDDHSTTSPGLLRRRLGRESGRLDIRWRTFEETRWPVLLNAAIRAYDTIGESGNPKFEALVAELDLLSRRSVLPKVVVRVPNQASARATEDALRASVPELARALAVEVHPWSTRLPWGSFDIAVHAGPPAVPQLPAIWSADAEEHIVLAYECERGLARYQWFDGVSAANQAVAASFGSFALSAPSPWAPVLVVDNEVDVRDGAGPAPALQASLERVVEQMRELEAAEQETDEVLNGTTTLIDRGMGGLTLRPVTLTSGRIWWVDGEATVDVLVGNKYRQRPIGQLQPGDTVVIPRGEGRESMFARLVAAYHSGPEVEELDFLLHRFRKACRVLYTRCGENWAEVRRTLESSGANAVNQTQAWADGETIAPEDARDVQLVARLVGDGRLETGWARIAATASVLRADHQRLGRIVSGALVELATNEGPCIERLKALLGPGAVEVLDEFAVATVSAVGGPETAPAAYRGTVR